MSGNTNDSTFCWEQALKGNRLFAISHVFAAPSTRAALIPLYALFSALAQVVMGSQDETVVNNRLAWWFREALEQNPDKSSHPIFRELVRCGAAGKIQSDSLQRLLLDCRSRVERPSLPDVEAVEELCIQMGLAQVDLELDICGRASNYLDVRGLACRRGLIQLVRESALGEGQGAWWWLPLNLMARHGITRADIDGGLAGENTLLLFSEVVEAVFQSSGTAVHMPPGPGAGLRHLYVMDALLTRKIGRLLSAGPQQIEGTFGRPGIVDAFTAWKAAVTFNRLR